MSEIIEIMGHPHIRYHAQSSSEQDLIQKSQDFYSLLDQRRSVREFSDKDIPMDVIENIVKTASTAPSGAHKQPWRFCVIKSAEIKREIRIAAEAEEKEAYGSRMSEQWKKDLLPLATTWEKPFLEIAPYLIVVFKKAYEDLDNPKATNYYINESVGIACGMLISAIHNAGLVTLTHTPQPMKFLHKILNRPKNEKPFLLLPVGYPADEIYVPHIHRKPLEEIMEVY